MIFFVTFTTTDIKNRLTTGSATGGDGDSDNDTAPIIEVVVSSGVLISVLDEIFDTLANKIVKKLADNVDDEAGDLTVIPVAAIYKVNHGKEEIYELSQTVVRFVLEQITTIIIMLRYCNRPSWSILTNSLVVLT